MDFIEGVFPKAGAKLAALPAVNEWLMLFGWPIVSTRMIDKKAATLMSLSSHIWL